MTISSKIEPLVQELVRRWIAVLRSAVSKGHRLHSLFLCSSTSKYFSILEEAENSGLDLVLMNYG